MSTTTLLANDLILKNYFELTLKLKNGIVERKLI